MKNVTKEMETIKKDIKINPLMTFLNGMKTGTKVFQHFLSISNLTQILDGKYMLSTTSFIYVHINLFIYIYR